MFANYRSFRLATGFIVVILTVAGLCPQLFAEEAASASASTYKAPAYQVLRQNENWSGLAAQDNNSGGDPFDSIKFIPLNDDGSFWISFGGQVRFRAEAWDNFGFGAPANDSDVYPLTRFFYHTDMHFGSHVRLFVEGKSAFVNDRDLPGGSRTLEEDKIALQNAFVEFSFAFSDDRKFSFRAGRQELLFGKQRLVSPLNWANTRRTFDGFSSTVKIEGWSLTGFWTRPVVIRQSSFNKNDPNTDFYGVYAAGYLPSTKVKLDVYWLGLNKEAATFNGTSGRGNRQTVGARVGGKIPDTAFDYDFESAFQFGEIGADNIGAYMVASQFGYTFTDVRTTPRVYLGFDYASGDDTAGGKVGTFSHLFPLGHAYMGFIDTVARQNIVDLNPGVAFKPFKKLSAAVAWHKFWRADTDDALYNAGTKVVRAGAAGTSSDVGSELDLTLKYKFDRHTVLVVGFNHFFAGDFIRESGSSQGVNFGYLTLQYTF